MVNGIHLRLQTKKVNSDKSKIDLLQLFFIHLFIINYYCRYLKSSSVKAGNRYIFFLKNDGGGLSTNVIVANSNNNNNINKKMYKYLTHKSNIYSHFV